MTLDEEIFAKIEEAVRLGFGIAQKHLSACQDDDFRYDYSGWEYAEVALEAKIADMRKAALGQGAT